MSTATYDDLISGMLPVGAAVDLSTIPKITIEELHRLGAPRPARVRKREGSDG